MPIRQAADPERHLISVKLTLEHRREICELQIRKEWWKYMEVVAVSIKLQLHLLFPARVLLQQNEPFQHARKRNIFFCCKLRTLCGCEPYGCLIGLEARDGARF